MALGPQYCKQLRRELRRHANFPPNRPVALGDYGVLRDEVFERLGNVRQLGITFEIIEGTAQTTFTFKSHGSVDFALIAKGDVQPGGIPAVRAGLEVKFSRAEAVFFNAAGCTVKAIDNVAAVGTALVQLLREGRWEADFHVVTELNLAAKTTAIASADRNSEIRLEAKSPALEAIQLGDASLDLQVKRSRNTALEIVTEGGNIPLMQLSRIRGMRRDEFRPESSQFEETGLPFTFAPDDDFSLSPAAAESAPLSAAMPEFASIPDSEPESAAFAVAELQAQPSDFEKDRAINAYIPLLRASYALANAEPVVMPPGYEAIGEIRASRAEMAEAEELLVPEAQEAVRNDVRAAESAAVPDAFGFVVREQATGAIIVSIRGTLTPAEWLKNFTAVPNPFNEVPGFGLVHLGFEKMWRSIRSSVAQSLTGVPSGTRITVLGHSLGGAMGVLGAVDICRNLGKSNVDVCTLGGPRVGKVRFRRNFNELIEKCFRLTNQNDVVPHVPSVLTAWNHVGIEIEVNGRVDNPHSLDAYLAGLRNIGSVREISAVPGVAVPESMLAGGVVGGVLGARTL
ncbi:MAG: lipase family protein [Bryobacteraceae bacterium]|nr:lipase family protein [Bryobacteraceae bacterium]